MNDEGAEGGGVKDDFCDRDSQFRPRADEIYRPSKSISLFRTSNFAARTYRRGSYPSSILFSTRPVVSAAPAVAIRQTGAVKRRCY